MDEQNVGLFLVGKNKFEIRKTNTAKVNTGEISLRVKACGICGSDLEYANNNKLRGGNAVILGHEIVGTVDSVGTETKKDASESQYVIIKPNLSCNKCEQCLRGNFNLCENLKTIGRKYCNGGFQQNMIVPLELCYQKPVNVDIESSVLIEPLAVCINAVKSSQFKSGMDVVVVGCGSIGIILVKLLKLFGAGKIFVCDPRQISRNFAEMYGADYIIDPVKNDFVSSIMHNTKHKGVDMIFEASGDYSSVAIAMEVSKPGSDLIMLSRPVKRQLKIPYYSMFKKELTLKVIRGFNSYFSDAINLMQNGLDIRQIITHKLCFNEVQQFFQDYKDYRNEVLKAVVIP
jgi:threonine dehydrogenase-like Zn-dependent dehydrogenase